MTPADAQRIADEFQDAYRAVARGPIAAPDGRIVRLPTEAAVANSSTNMTNVDVLAARAATERDVSQALQVLARRVAAKFIDKPRAFFYRLPHTGEPTCATAEVDRLPCRVYLRGPLRDSVQIEVGVRA